MQSQQNRRKPRSSVSRDEMAREKPLPNIARDPPPPEHVRDPWRHHKTYLYVLALFFPPAAVLLYRGCHGEFIISILLTCLGWIPGAIYAWWMMNTYEPLDDHMFR